LLGLALAHGQVDDQLAIGAPASTQSDEHHPGDEQRGQQRDDEGDDHDRGLPAPARGQTPEPRVAAPPPHTIPRIASRDAMTLEVGVAAGTSRYGPGMTELPRSLDRLDARDDFVGRHLGPREADQA